MRSGPLVGKVATSPLLSWGSPSLQRGGQNQKWLICGQCSYVTPTLLGIPTAAERGAKSEVAHKWARWLRLPCPLRDPRHFTAGSIIRSGPPLGKVATSPLPSPGWPPLHIGGQNQKWPSYGQSGYVTDTSGYPHRFRARGKTRSGPQVGKVATAPLPSLRSPALHSGGQNQKQPTWGQSGYVSPAVSGIPRLENGRQNQKRPTSGQRGCVIPTVSVIPTASGKGAKSEVAQLWAKWLRHSCCLGDSHHCGAEGKIRSGPLGGKVATSPPPSWGSAPLHSGRNNQK